MEFKIGGTSKSAGPLALPLVSRRSQIMCVLPQRRAPTLCLEPAYARWVFEFYGNAVGIWLSIGVFCSSDYLGQIAEAAKNTFSQRTTGFLTRLR